jgi:hypothetical protein
VIKPDSKSVFRTVAILGLTIPILIGIALLGGSSISDWYARRMPPRSYERVPLYWVIQDLEAHGVIPLGTTWESDSLKGQPLTMKTWLLPTDREVILRIAQGAGMVIAYPMGQHGEIMGPLHVRATAGGKPGVEWLYGKNRPSPAYAPRS